MQRRGGGLNYSRPDRGRHGIIGSFGILSVALTSESPLGSKRTLLDGFVPGCVHFPSSCDLTILRS